MSSLLAQPWAVVVMGLAVAALCFVMGWSLLRQRSRGATGKSAEDLLPRVVADRRTGCRRTGNCVTVDLAEGDATEAPKSAWVLDRSTGGMRLEVDREFAVGAVLKVRPRTAASPPWTDVVVRSCKPDNGVWHLGLQFVKTPSYNLLMLFG
jgi:hypothetical protein